MISIYPRRTLCRGFTLIELLVVMGVAGLLAAILIPTVSKVLSKAHEGKCSANLREIGNLLSIYAAGHGGVTVPTYDHGLNWSILISEGTRGNMPSSSDSVFRCPANSEQEFYYLADMQGENACSYTINGFRRPGSHPDTYDKENRYTSNRLANFEHPALTYAVFEGTYYRSQVGGGKYTLVRYPHNGKMNILFADGHVESVAKPEDGDYLPGYGAYSGSSWPDDGSAGNSYSNGKHWFAR